MRVTYSAAVAHLLSLGFELKAGKFFLDDIRKLMAAMGDPQDASPVVLIAGTNGKGSTAAMIEAALREAGYRTGLYTSPHLVRVNERIRVSGEEITDDAFAAAWERVSEAIEKMLAAGDLPKHPSFFECLTAMAWVHFRDAGVEIQVLEVGMGGRLDATNITRPIVSVITPVDFDHEAYLGNTIELIAAEKAGIIKENGVVVMAAQSPAEGGGGAMPAAGAGGMFAQMPAAESVITGVAAERHARLVRVADLAEGYQLSLAGEHQKQNAATALATLAELRAMGWRLPDDVVRRALASTHWPGRLERIATHPATYLDGAHNPAGARVLRDFLATAAHPRVLVFGAMRDKAIGEMAELLFPEVDAVVLTKPSHHRATSPETLRDMTSHLNVYIYVRTSPMEALGLATRIAGTAGTVVVAGSLFLVGDLLRLQELDGHAQAHY